METNSNIHQPMSPTYFSGQLAPHFARRRSHPVIERKLPIGTEGNLFTLIKVWVYEPTVQFPTVSIFFSANNGRGSCFTRLTSAELRALAIWLQTTADEIDKVIPQLEARQAIIENKLEEINKLNIMMKQMNLNPETGELPPYDLGDGETE